MLGRWMINLRVFFFILVDDEIVRRGDKRMLMLFLLLRCRSNSVDVFSSFRLQSNLAENSPLTQKWKKKVKNCLYRWKVPLDFKIGLWTWREASGGKATDINWSLLIFDGDFMKGKQLWWNQFLKQFSFPQILWIRLEIFMEDLKKEKSFDGIILWYKRK